MGRLTLNMLLSFAQFEREVAGERIRDKIAASKRKGMWMGGYAPLGYEARDRSMIINEAEAETVRTVFRLYLELGNVRRVKEEADRLGLTTKVRRTEDGRMRGGRPLSRGHIYKLLGNPLYAGRIAHKGASHEGLHEPIIDAKTWEAVQAKLADNARDRRSGTHITEPSLLAGLLRDGCGNRLTPSHAIKNGARYRYYVSQATLQNRNSDMGAIIRMPAREIEELVCAGISSLLNDPKRLLEELGDSLSPCDQRRLVVTARELVERWPQQSIADRRRFLVRIVAGIVVTAREIRISLNRNALRYAPVSDEGSTQGPNADPGQAATRFAGDELLIVIPMQLKRCSGAMRLVITPGHP
jgi:hypothetical protein